MGLSLDTNDGELPRELCNIYYNSAQEEKGQDSMMDILILIKYQTLLIGVNFSRLLDLEPLVLAPRGEKYLSIALYQEFIVGFCWGTFGYLSLGGFWQVKSYQSLLSSHLYDHHHHSRMAIECKQQLASYVFLSSGMFGFEWPWTQEKYLRRYISSCFFFTCVCIWTCLYSRFLVTHSRHFTSGAIFI